MNVLKNAERYLKKLLLGNRVRVDYYADGLGVRGRNMTFLNDPIFEKAWQEVAAFNNPYWNGVTPDIRWRAHLVVWAAEQAIRLDGDFAEFGVNTGILSSMIFKCTDVAKSDRKFFLFDTFEGIPLDQSSPTERQSAKNLNRKFYEHDSYKAAKSVFSRYDNAILVRGILPASLDDVEIDKLCYVSIDLNVAKPEIAVIEAIWDKLVPGALVVLDDYNFAEYCEQHAAWNEFASSKSQMIFQSPTGQGLLIK